MGREIKRVPLDFDWPLNEVWDGFLNPYYVAVDCAYCKGTGYGILARQWKEKWYGWDTVFLPEETGSAEHQPSDSYIFENIRHKIAHTDTEYYLSAANTHSLDTAAYFEAIRMCRIWNSAWCYHLDQEDVQALFDEKRLHHLPGGHPEVCPNAYDLNRAYLFGFGHDSINSMLCVDARCQRNSWASRCWRCKGSGHLWPSKEAEERFDAWEETEPPEGDGWQIWETVSEGSPISPVFASADELVHWLTKDENGAYSWEAAENFVHTQWAPSMLGTASGELLQDIEACREMEPALGLRYGGGGKSSHGT